MQFPNFQRGKKILKKKKKKKGTPRPCLLQVHQFPLSMLPQNSVRVKGPGKGVAFWQVMCEKVEVEATRAEPTSDFSRSHLDPKACGRQDAL